MAEPIEIQSSRSQTSVVYTSLPFIIHQADLIASRIEFEREWLPKFKGEIKKVNNFAVTKAPKQTIKTKTLSNVKSQGLMDMLDNI